MGFQNLLWMHLEGGCGARAESGVRPQLPVLHSRGSFHPPRLSGAASLMRCGGAAREEKCRYCGAPPSLSPAAKMWCMVEPKVMSAAGAERFIALGACLEAVRGLQFPM